MKFPELSKQFDSLLQTVSQLPNIAYLSQSESKGQLENSLAPVLIGEHIENYRKRLFALAQAAMILERGNKLEVFHTLFHFIDDYLGPILYELLDKDDPFVESTRRGLVQLRGEMEKGLNSGDEQLTAITFQLSSTAAQKLLKRACSILRDRIQLLQRWDKSKPFPAKHRVQGFIDMVLLRKELQEVSENISESQARAWTLRIIGMLRRGSSPASIHKATENIFTDNRLSQQALKALESFAARDQYADVENYQIIQDQARDISDMIRNIFNILESIEGFRGNLEEERMSLQGFFSHEDSKKKPMSFEDQFRLLEHEEVVRQEGTDSPWIGIEKYFLPSQGHVFETIIPYFLEQVIGWKAERPSNDVEDFLDGVDVFFSLPPQSSPEDRAVEFAVDVYLNGSYRSLATNPFYLKKCGKARMLGVMTGIPHVVVALAKDSVWYDLVIFMLHEIVKSSSLEVSSEMYKSMAKNILRYAWGHPDLGPRLRTERTELCALLRRQFLNAKVALQYERLATERSSATIPQVAEEAHNPQDPDLDPMPA